MLNPEFEDPFDQDIETYESTDFAAELDLICAIFSPDLDVIYYPGCSSDSSMGLVGAFSGKRVIHLDVMANAIRALKEKGFEAYVGDSEEFDPGVVDLLIMQNFESKKAPDYVRASGYVVCNDWWGAATDMKERDDYKLQAVVVTDPNGGLIVDKDNLEDFWKIVESDEEWKRKSEFSFGRARASVLHYFGDDSHVLEKFKLIVEEGERRIGLTDFGPNGEVLTRIPKKRSGGFFIFQRVKEDS